MEPTLPIMESFHSLQGEGAHNGKSAFFIRLAGCNVACSWCDTKESWLEQQHAKQSVLTLAKYTAEAQREGASFVVITGGEPLQHDLNPLCKAIKDTTSTINSHSIPIHLETSGVYKMSGTINWITLSPKIHLPPRKELLKKCQEIKVIIHNEEDLLFAEEMAHQASEKEKNSGSDQEPMLYLQPGWKSEKGKTLAIDYVKKNSKWTLSMQTHKWLGVA